MMRMLRRVAAAIRRWTSGTRAEHELRNEVESYAQLLEDEHRARGVTPDAARRLALIDLGGATQVEEHVRQSRAGAWIEQTTADVVYAVRGLRRSPAATLTVIVTLGLGIGANLAVFSVLDASLLKPLPYDHPEELVDLGHRVRVGTKDESTFVGLSWQEMDAWRQEMSIFAGIEAYSGRLTPTKLGGTDAVVSITEISAGLPKLLGITPIVGRMFTVDEAALRAPVVVISEPYWRAMFAARTDAIGQTLSLDSGVVMVVGVLPKTFRYGPGIGGNAQVFRAASASSLNINTERGMASPVFRVRRGLSLAQAELEANVVASRWQVAKPEREPWRAELIPFDARERKAASSRMESPLVLMLAIVLVVLLVACANVANVLITRSLDRRREMVLRAALGAPRGRLVRLLLAEGIVLTSLGGVTGWILAAALIEWLPLLMPVRLRFAMFTRGLPTIDDRLLVFSAVVLGSVAMLASVIPAIRGAAIGPLRDVSDTGRVFGASPRRRRLAGALQAIQVALALVLVTSAVAVGGSLVNLYRAPLGFDPTGLLNITMQLPSKYPQGPAQAQFFDDLLQRVRGIPGVTAVAYGVPPPSKGSGRLSSPSQPGGSAPVPGAVRSVGSGYFAALGIPLIAGREFDARDGSKGEGTAIVDQSAANALWPGTDAIGQKITYSPYVPPATVIGVVGDVAAYDFRSGTPGRALYRPLAKEASAFATLIVRTDRDSAAMTRSLTAMIRSAEPAVVLTNVGLVTDRYDEMETFTSPRFFAALIATFAVIALVISAVGVYGVQAHNVSQRQREFGVRLALGATNQQVRRLVLGQALRITGVGVVAGWMLTWAVSSYLTTLLFRTDRHDVALFFVSGLVMLMSSVVATIVPTRRAIGIGPLRAIKE